jgi:hypothetical protein
LKSKLQHTATWSVKAWLPITCIITQQYSYISALFKNVISSILFHFLNTTWTWNSVKFGNVCTSGTLEVCNWTEAWSASKSSISPANRTRELVWVNRNQLKSVNEWLTGWCHQNDTYNNLDWLIKSTCRSCHNYAETASYKACPESKDAKVLNMYNIFNLKSDTVNEFPTRKFHSYTVHQQYPTLYFPTNAHNVKNVVIKIFF